MGIDDHGRPAASAFDGGRGLRKATAWDLGCALLRRLQSESTPGSRVAGERQAALFTALHEGLGRALEVPENRCSVLVVAQQLGFLRRCAERHGLPLIGAVHLEVGCGAISPYARLFTHLLLGVARAHGLEPEPPRDPAQAVRVLARLATVALLDPRRLFGTLSVDAANVLERLHGFDLAKLEQGDPRGIDPSRLRIEQRSLADNGLPTGSVDVTLSNSVLEHVHDVPAALAELARLTRPGGFGIHGIDVADHRVYGDPAVHRLEFLTADPHLAMVAGSNRLRLCDHERLFAAHGFEIVDREVGPPIAIPPALRSRMQPPWRQMADEQLATVWAQYLVRRR